MFLIFELGEGVVGIEPEISLFGESLPMGIHHLGFPRRDLIFFIMHQVTNYLQEIAPDLCDRVELYSKRTLLFDEYDIEQEINSILSKRLVLFL